MHDRNQIETEKYLFFGHFFKVHKKVNTKSNNIFFLFTSKMYKNVA